MWATHGSAQCGQWIDSFKGFGQLAARACLAAGREDLAAEMLERSLAIELSQSANIKLADLTLLRETHPHLVVPYEHAVSTWQVALARVDPTEIAEQRWLRIRLARLTVYQAMQALRHADPDFGEPMRWSRIADVSAQGALVYLSTDSEGGLGILVREGRAEALPGLEEASTSRVEHLLAEVLRRYAAHHGTAQQTADEVDAPSWVGRLLRRSNQDQPPSQASSDDWNEALNEVLQELWPLLMSPLRRELQKRGIAEATLIAGGALAGLPLHLAWQETGGERRYAMHDLCLSYAPSVGLLGRARATLPHCPPAGQWRVLAILDDRTDVPTEKRLDAAATQARAALAALHGERLSVLDSRNGTREAVMTALPAVDLVYFLGHGAAAAPPEASSALTLPSGEALPLDKIARQVLQQRLWILVACEAGRAHSAAPDEAQSFAGGLLQCGVAAVMASPYTLTDDLAVPLSVDLLRSLAAGVAPIQALRQAQLRFGAAAAPISASPVAPQLLAMGAMRDLSKKTHYLPRMRPGHWALQCFGV